MKGRRQSEAVHIVWPRPQFDVVEIEIVYDFSLSCCGNRVEPIRLDTGDLGHISLCQAKRRFRKLTCPSALNALPIVRDQGTKAFGRYRAKDDVLAVLAIFGG